jgi:hypothetical protein
MTKRDYKAFADLVRQLRSPELPEDQDFMTVPLGSLVHGLCGIFSADNPRFDCKKFRDACYGE